MVARVMFKKSATGPERAQTIAEMQALGLKPVPVWNGFEVWA